MTREEAIKILSERYSSALFSERTALETLIPELAESEDERIRKEIVEYFKHYSGGDNASIKFPKWIEWLENHKPSFKQISNGIIWDSGLRTGIELGKKQKEQKSAEFDEYKIIKKHITEDSLSSEVNKRLTECGWYVTDEKPAVWSKEEQTIIEGACNALEIYGHSKLADKLKSLCPQSKDEIYKEKNEAFKLGKHQLAIKFMNYLDENRPEGKMSLSNGECEDIDNAFKENDWTKIMRYAKKYLIQSEQQPAEWGEEDEKMLLSIINAFRKGAVSTIGQEQWLKSLPERFNLQPKNEWNEDYREEDIQTRFAFYTYRDDPSTLYLSNVFVEEASRNHHFGTRILRAAEKVAETIGATTISLKVRQDSPANTWYRKNGYGYVAFEDGYDWLEKNLEYMKSKPQIEQGQKPLEYLPKEKINSIMSKLTNLSFSKLIPFNSEEYKKIDEITTDVCDLLDYPIEKKQEQKPVDEQFPPLEGLDAIKAKYYDDGFKNGFDEGVESVKPVGRSLEDDHIIGFVYDLLNEIEWKDNWAMSKDECLRLLNNYRPQKPAEWSEEDKKMQKDIIQVLKSYIFESNPSLCGSFPTYYLEESFGAAKDWLESLPERFNLEPK